MLELREFVSETLAQIIGGIADAQAATGGRGAVINPRIYSVRADGFGEVGDRGSASAQRVEFDVAVASAEGIGAKGRIGVLSFGFGAEAGGGTTSSVVSRIRFAVFVQMPESPTA